MAKETGQRHTLVDLRQERGTSCGHSKIVQVSPLYCPARWQLIDQRVAVCFERQRAILFIGGKDRCLSVVFRRIGQRLGY